VGVYSFCIISDKLVSIPEVEPDEIDRSIVEDATAQDDGTFVALNDFRTLMSYNGKLSLRIPRNLHMKLVEDAKLERISLNQYALYKLSR
jgi:hypothetical protein